MHKTCNYASEIDLVEDQIICTDKLFVYKTFFLFSPYIIMNNNLDEKVVNSYVYIKKYDTGYKKKEDCI